MNENNENAIDEQRTAECGELYGDDEILQAGTKVMVRTVEVYGDGRMNVREFPRTVGKTETVNSLSQRLYLGLELDDTVHAAVEIRHAVY